MNNINIVSDEDYVDPMRRLYTAESGLKYPERLPPDDTSHVGLDLTHTPLEVYIRDVEKLDAKGFTLARRNGFGGSDSGCLLGVNPHMSLSELIAQKASSTLSEEELATSNQIAVIKGNDLEPLIIDKFQKIFNMKTVKPTDMYVYKEWPYLKMDFDGVTGTPEQYIPVEIKVVTKRGEKHYNPDCCLFIEGVGYQQAPQHYELANNSIETKATGFGIPAYYYTQVQAEMMALNAPFGFLCSLWEAEWTLHVYLIYKDETIWNALKIEGYKAWQQVEMLKQKTNKAEEVKKLMVMNQHVSQYHVQKILKDEVLDNAFAPENPDPLSQPGPEAY